MPSYRTNIELHHAATDDYLLLDKELRSHQFSPESKQQIADTAKSEKKYLRIRYIKEGNIALQEVVDNVKRAAAKTGKKFSFTVLKNKN
ncbi:hypothetical protein DC498_12660 [Terrimonas sp.]|uniref:hypothetical protein n=1 Tax=Terrimonas sp. TaxID=1914338 RepID=UPI000D51014C|nr:hypothetical protein [Terrimonas sp.]PVD51893.1 hypothetical protein DC498_12660 [Terrimonas sp.]